MLVDCLTLWLSNLMHAEADLDEATDELVMALDGYGAPVVFVSNEVGLGLVPETALGRAFRDAQGRLNMRMAERADRVILMAAGLPPMKDRPGRLEFFLRQMPWCLKLVTKCASISAAVAIWRSPGVGHRTKENKE